MSYPAEAGAAWGAAYQTQTAVPGTYLLQRSWDVGCGVEIALLLKGKALWPLLAQLLNICFILSFCPINLHLWCLRHTLFHQKAPEVTRSSFEGVNAISRLSGVCWGDEISAQVTGVWVFQLLVVTHQVFLVGVLRGWSIESDFRRAGNRKRLWCLHAAHSLLLCEPQDKIIMADKSLGLRPSWKEIWDFVRKYKPNRLHLPCVQVTRLIHDFTLYLLLFFASLSSCCVRGMSFVSIHFLLQGHGFSFFTLVKLNISSSYRYRCLT